MLAEVIINVAVPVRVNGSSVVTLTSLDDAGVLVTLPDPIGSVEDEFLNGAEEEVERISPVLTEPKLVPLIVLVATVTTRPLETVVPVRIDTVLLPVPVGIKLDPLRLPMTVERVRRPVPVPVPVTINPVPFRLAVVIEAVILTLPVPLRLPVGMETGTLPMPVPLLPVRIEILRLPVGGGPIPEPWKEGAVTLNIYG